MTKQKEENKQRQAVFQNLPGLGEACGMACGPDGCSLADHPKMLAAKKHEKTDKG